MSITHYELPADKQFPAVEAHMRLALERYLNGGVTPGNFLTAVLENNLMNAVRVADQYNRAHLATIVGYLMEHMPVSSWGNRQLVDSWMERVQEVTNYLQQAG